MVPVAASVTLPRPALALSLCTALALGVAQAGGAQASCRFLLPIGGGGEPVVSKRIGPDRLVGSTNWNTDFAVDRTFARYRFNFESASTGRGVFPVAGFLRFTDGSSLQVFSENLTLDPGQRRSFGPFAAVPGKRTNQLNFRVGSSRFPGSTGFSYRISVEGCN
jgi:hypothetical protein